MQKNQRLVLNHVLSNMMKYSLLLVSVACSQNYADDKPNFTNTKSILLQNHSQNSPINSNSSSQVKFTPPSQIFIKNDDENHTLKNQNPYLDVPSIGTKIGVIEQQQEKDIAEKVLREVRLQLPTVQDMWLEYEILQLFNRMYAPTGLGQPIAVVLIQNNDINAFAVPGGLFAVNTGTITSAKNIDELAGVVAHEIAHVSQRHYSRSKEASGRQNLLMMMGMLAGLALATQSGDAGMAVMLGTQASSIHNRLAYSRDQEREADRVGMQYMALANFNPNSMADFFENMQRSTTRLSIIPEFWLTHPLTSARISEARLRARQFSITNSLTIEKQQYFELLRWRAITFSKPLNLTLLKSSANENTSAGLALASYHIQNAEYEEAKKILQKIKPTTVQKILYDLTWSEWYFAQKQYDKSLQSIESDYQIMPENPVLAVQMAKNLLEKQDFASAKRILNPLAEKYPRQTMIWQLLQRIAEQDKAQDKNMATIQVLRYRAEVQYWSGEEEQAIRSLLSAKRLLNTYFSQDKSLLSKIEQRLTAMQDKFDFKDNS